MKLINGTVAEKFFNFDGTTTEFKLIFDGHAHGLIYGYHCLEIYVTNVTGGNSADNWDLYAEAVDDSGALLDNFKLKTAVTVGIGTDFLDNYLTGVAPSDKTDLLIVHLNQYDHRVFTRNLQVRLVQGGGSLGDYTAGKFFVRHLAAI